MKPNTFIKRNKSEDIIYLNKKIIGNYINMINVIINNPEEKYNFENFNKQELKLAKIITKIYSKKIKDRYTKKTITITTHKLKQKIKKYYYLDMFNFYKDT